MERFDIINELIKRNNYQNYLEIGYQDGICYQKINIPDKNAVDPFPRKTEDSLFIMTSDEFFKVNKKKYDIIFIDGLHTYEQVTKDFENSLQCINPNGVIVFHDMNPNDTMWNGRMIPGKERAISFNDGGQWNGDCYKLAIDMYNGKYDYYYFTVDTDQGCLVLYPSIKRSVMKNYISKDYDSFKYHRQVILNLMSVNKFNDL